MNSRIEAYQKAHEIDETIMCQPDGPDGKSQVDPSVDPSIVSGQSPPGSVPPEINTAGEEMTEGTDRSRPWLNRAIDFYWANEFVILVVIVILLARAYPPLGAEYLYPQITATWIAVVFIFGKQMLPFGAHVQLHA